MQQISIKEEDTEVNEQLPLKPGQAMFLNNLGFMTEEDDSKDVKKELKVFDGLPNTLQIQPLPDALMEGVFEENNSLNRATTSRIIFRVYFRFD